MKRSHSCHIYQVRREAAEAGNYLSSCQSAIQGRKVGVCRPEMVLAGVKMPSRVSACHMIHLDLTLSLATQKPPESTAVGIIKRYGDQKVDLLLPVCEAEKAETMPSVQRPKSVGSSHTTHSLAAINAIVAFFKATAKTSLLFCVPRHNVSGIFFLYFLFLTKESLRNSFPVMQ